MRRRAAAAVYPERDSKGHIVWTVDAMPDIYSAGYQRKQQAVEFAKLWCPEFVIYPEKPKGDAE